MLIISELTKQFPGMDRPALKAISATVRTGRITGLVGPDGAGKTTLMRLIAGLFEPSGGHVTAFGLDVIREDVKLHELLGYMPQKFGLYEDLSVLENLTLYAKLRNLPKSERKDRFTELLKFTGLERFTGRLAKRLSGGMKQKLGLACSLVKMPKLLLLDEPGVGVDPISRRELWRMVRALVADDVIVLWSTAYLDEAERCDDVILLNEGKMLFFGDPQNLTGRLDNRVVQVRGIDTALRRGKLTELLKEPEVIDGVIQGNAIRLVLKNSLADSAMPTGGIGQAKTVFSGCQIVPVPPRFEDGFVDILGGMPKMESLLAKNMPVIPATEKPVVVAKGLTKQFGTFVAANQITFEIKRGEIFGLLGPNGAGKSTTFKMLCGLLRPTAGEGFIAGHNLLKSASKARSRLGYMAQKFSLYGDLTVAQNLSFFAGAYGLFGAKRKAKTELMLDLFDLKQFSGMNSSLLSLGFKQRLSLACAIMHEPDVLFLDEPTSGVDPLTRREFWGHITALIEKGVTVLVTTHFMDEAEYCDRIILIYDGKAIAEGTPDQLKTGAGCDSLDDAFVKIIQKGFKP